MSLSKERREELRQEVHEVGDTRIVGDWNERVTIGELRALLDMADERDRYRALLRKIPEMMGKAKIVTAPHHHAVSPDRIHAICNELDRYGKEVSAALEGKHD